MLMWLNMRRICTEQVCLRIPEEWSEATSWEHGAPKVIGYVQNPFKDKQIVILYIENNN
jgi:hypothetical protein